MGALVDDVLASALERADLNDKITVDRDRIVLPSPLPVADLAAAAVGAASIAADVLTHVREHDRPAQAHEVSQVRLDGATLTAAYRSEQVFRLNGEPPTAWAPASGFFRTASGWVRAHANYRHHADELKWLLGLPSVSDPDQVAAALREGKAAEWEERAARVGAIIIRVRTRDEWLEHPQRAAVAAEPLVTRHVRDVHAPPLPPPDTPTGQAEFHRPLTGVRVLDLTRVIAGPVATRTLAAFGADVLRVDPPHLPEIGWQYLDTGDGKRSTLLNLARSRDRARFDELLSTADVLVTSYRPRALDRFGYGPGQLRERFPHVIIASVNAWGTTGMWARRRGFDSIVQAASGIAMRHASNGRPGVLPAQALDHSAGYLLAAAVMHALAQRQLTGVVHELTVSLARLAELLFDAEPKAEPPATVSAPENEGSWRDKVDVIHGPDGVPITRARSALVFRGEPVDTTTRPPGAYGADPGVWR